VTIEVAGEVAPRTSRLTFDAPAHVRAALDAAGRTEDVRVSPDGRRLALACYSENAIGAADVEVGRASSEVRAAVTGFELLRAPGVREPHGVDFVTDDVVAVANRGGSVAFFTLPERGSGGELAPWGDAAGAPAARDGPGSVLVRRGDAGECTIFVCSNWVDTVTRHVLEADGELATGEVVAQRRLELPDGVALSHDGAWLAVSSHDSSTVLLFAYPTGGGNDEPVCILRGVRCPHGLRFASDDRRLLVADAAAPYVHVFESAADGWADAAYPTSSVRVLDDRAFARWRRNRYEGGPKGIDVLEGDVLVVTCEGTTLAFFDLARIPDDAPSDLRLQYELHVLDELADRRAAAADVRRELDALRQTRAWRLLRPAREGYARLRRLGRR
jgi:hypothetical protein